MKTLKEKAKETRGILTVKDLADQINKSCYNFQYLLAYGTVKETRDLWRGDSLELLCDEAKTMVGQVAQWLTR